MAVWKHVPSDVYENMQEMREQAHNESLEGIFPVFPPERYLGPEPKLGQMHTAQGFREVSLPQKGSGVFTLCSMQLAL